MLTPMSNMTLEPRAMPGACRRAGGPMPGCIEAGAGDDAALIEAVVAGDPAALDRLFVRYRRDAFAAAFALLRDPCAAEDVVRDAFLRVWTSAGTFRPDRGTAKGWIVAIARNAALDRLRSGQFAQRRQAALYQAGTVSQHQDDVAAMAVMAADARRLHASLAKLPAPQRRVIELAYFADLTHGQIAEVTKTPLGTVKGRIRLSLRRLRQDLREPATPGSATRN